MPENWKVKMVQVLIKNWWKLILIVLAVALAITGFSFRLGPLACQKSEIKVKAVEVQK